jgi:hypothetical protein
VVKQIGFYADDADEAQFTEVVAGEGAVFLPSCYPKWPLPVLRLPLPAPTEPYMAHVVIWHPEIFRESEMFLEGNRPYNPAGKFYLANLWPVLEFFRPHPVNRPVYWAACGSTPGMHRSGSAGRRRSSHPQRFRISRRGRRS